jgi:hypothetical protein
MILKYIVKWQSFIIYATGCQFKSDKCLGQVARNKPPMENCRLSRLSQLQATWPPGLDAPYGRFTQFMPQLDVDFDA